MTRFDFRERAPIEEITEDFSMVLEEMNSFIGVDPAITAVANVRNRNTVRSVVKTK
jgi:hypothetical protein